jgi:hypothetical protein
MTAVKNFTKNVLKTILKHFIFDLCHLYDLQ